MLRKGKHKLMRKIVSHESIKIFSKWPQADIFLFSSHFFLSKNNSLWCKCLLTADIKCTLLPFKVKLVSWNFPGIKLRLTPQKTVEKQMLWTIFLIYKTKTASHTRLRKHTTDNTVNAKRSYQNKSTLLLSWQSYRQGSRYEASLPRISRL